MNLIELLENNDVNLTDEKYCDLGSYLYSDEFEEQYMNNIYFTDYIPARIEDNDEYSKIEIYYDGIKRGKVHSEEYQKMVEKYLGYFKSMFCENGILILSSITLNNSDSKKITNKSLNEITLPDYDIVDSDFLKTNDDILKLALAERAHIILIDKTKKIVMFVDGFHCQTFLLDNNQVEIVRDELKKFSLFLWKDEIE